MLRDTSTGVQRCVEIQARLLRTHYFSTLLEILGSCEDDDTLAFLARLAEDDAVHERWRGEAISAIAAHRSEAAGEWILDHQEAVGEAVQGSGRHVHDLLQGIRDRASRENEFRRRLLDTARDGAEGPIRGLLNELLRDMEGEEAGFLAAYLLNDREGAPSYWVQRQFEEAFFQREDAGFGGAYRLVPQSSNELRRLLYDFVVSDPNRRKSAAQVLIGLENGRLEMGRPVDEPRHPNWAERQEDPWQLRALG